MRLRPALPRPLLCHLLACLLMPVGLQAAPAPAPSPMPAPAVRADDPALQALAKERKCLGCHQLERKVVGPAYRDVAARYAGQPQALARLALKIRQGGGGAWGPVVMPANPVSEDEARRLAAWVLAQPPATKR